MNIKVAAFVSGVIGVVVISALTFSSMGCGEEPVRDFYKNGREMKNMEDAISYYGMDRSLKVVEHGPVSLDLALKVVDERFSKLKAKYDTAEEAISETMFGFSRPEGAFIEICINGPSKISFKFEYPQSKKFFVFQWSYENESVLASKEELVKRVQMFFSTSTEAYKQYIESLKK